MNVHNFPLSRKYATAYLNVYGESISQDSFYNIKRAYLFLKDESELLFLFKIPSADAVKKEVVTTIFKHYSIPDSLQQVVDLLIDHDRLFLLSNILFAIVTLYEKRNSIVEFKVKSFPQLDEQKKKKLELFLAKKAEATVLCHYEKDETLIAGIRAQSSTLLWENSVALRLREFERSLSLAEG